MELKLFCYWSSIVSLLVAMAIAVPTPDRVSCQAGCYIEGDAARVQCQFNKDLNLTRHNFNVVHYPVKGSSGDRESNTVSDSYVVLCNWDAASTLTCKTAEGYHFNHVVSTTLSVEIRAASLHHDGEYACQLVPTDAVLTDTCRLTVLRPKSRSSSDAAALNSLIIIGLFTAVLILSIILILVICCMCRLLKRFYLVPKVKDAKKHKSVKKNTVEEQELLRYPQTEIDTPSDKHGTKQVGIEKSSHEPARSETANETVGTPAWDASEKVKGESKNEKEKKEKKKKKETVKYSTESTEPMETTVYCPGMRTNAKRQSQSPYKRIFCGLGQVYTSVQAAVLANEPKTMLDKEVQVDPDIIKQSKASKTSSCILQ